MTAKADLVLDMTRAAGVCCNCLNRSHSICDREWCVCRQRGHDDSLWWPGVSDMKHTKVLTAKEVASIKKRPLDGDVASRELLSAGDLHSHDELQRQVRVLREALTEIQEETHRKQLPLTNKINDTATKALQETV